MKQKHDPKTKKSHQESEHPSRKSSSPPQESNPRRRSDNEAKIENDMILRR
ncbi:hypothetical protein OVA24_21130 [Luteolibacter sp. SL250]|uniref:hypothetical protein n=1 Tax=Luteolibacter sp. SL250 TaxID=2995170 RepID=UPI002270D967|nr:hypothetical protein [Luteolibacter sp. SL250]WAC19726.1 hypothetical protein OVA24_21130 [Luteolibacter sp. SL250]